MKILSWMTKSAKTSSSIKTSKARCSLKSPKPQPKLWPLSRRRQRRILRFADQNSTTPPDGYQTLRLQLTLANPRSILTVMVTPTLQLVALTTVITYWPTTSTLNAVITLLFISRFTTQHYRRVSIVPLALECQQYPYQKQYMRSARKSSRSCNREGQSCQSRTVHCRRRKESKPRLSQPSRLRSLRWHLLVLSTQRKAWKKRLDFNTRLWNKKSSLSLGGHHHARIRCAVGILGIQTVFLNRAPTSSLSESARVMRHRWTKRSATEKVWTVIWWAQLSNRLIAGFMSANARSEKKTR